MFSRTLIFTLTMTIGLFFSTLAAETNSLSPFIDGYSPVSYFTVNKAEKGSPEFAVNHKGKLYYLTSAKQVEIFNQDPNKYTPKYDVCPYSLALGKITPLDPTNFKIVANTLLLFHKTEVSDGLKLWNESDITDQELINRANKRYIIYEFNH